MELLIIAVVAFLASTLTFFSGFGLGTLLAPVMMIWFPAEVAIALTAIVHLCNNIFKIFLTGRNISMQVVLRFGIPTILFAFIGSYLMLNLSSLEPITSYNLFGRSFEVRGLNFIIGLLLITFVIIEFIPSVKNLEIPRKFLPVGGAISGFFGGLTGHQGALRNAFLIKAGLSKEIFIATTVLISTMVDFSRIAVYSSGISFSRIESHLVLLICAIFAAIAGAFLGNFLLKKITIEQLKWFVGVMLFLFGLGMVSGII